VEIGRVQSLGLLGENTLIDLDPMASQPGDTLPGDPGIGVDRTHNHPCHPGRDEGIDTGWGSTVEGTRFKGDYHRPPPGCGSGCDQSRSFGMGVAWAQMCAFADHFADRVQDECSDSGIGVGTTCPRQFDRPAHVGGVVLTTQSGT